MFLKKTSWYDLFRFPKKTFDKVPHNLLIEKIQSFEVNGNRSIWLNLYLANRKQHVVLQDKSSVLLKVTSDVPQGSILAPLLFIFYTNDMSPKLQHSTIALFADDSKCYLKITKVENCQELQGNINRRFVKDLVGIIKRYVGELASANVLKQLYVSIVMPQHEYGTPYGTLFQNLRYRH